MDQFEILGSSGNAPDDEPSEDSTGGPRWILAVPVLAMVALLVGLTQGGEAPAVDDSPTTTAADGEALTTTRAESDDDAPSTTPVEGPPPLADDAVVELLASFDDRVMVSSGQGGDLQAQRLSETEPRPLDIEGTPLAIAEDWLILGRGNQVVALDLADETSVAIELATDGFSVELVEVSAGMVLIAGSGDGGQFNIVGFEIGEWGDVVVETDRGFDFSVTGVGFSSPVGSGTFELTASGYQRRGNGQILSYSSEFVVLEECEVDPLECFTVMRDRSTWDEVSRLTDQLGSSFGQVSISQDGPVAFVSNLFSEPEHTVVDLLTGTVVVTVGDTFGWGEPVRVNSNDAGLLVSVVPSVSPLSRGPVVVIDRETGFEVAVGVGSGILVRADLPRLVAAGG